ncbi:MAG: AMP-binding protein, partial [Acidobacteriota bacterium]
MGKIERQPSLRFSTLIELLRLQAQQQPEKCIYTFLENGVERETLTFSELDTSARAIAALLQQYRSSEERALLLFPPGLEFIKAFFGCLYSGVIAVPAYPPEPARLSRTLSRLLTIVKDAQPTFALTTSAILSIAQYFFDQESDFQQIRWIATDTIDSICAQQWQERKIKNTDLAFLQYTSGATSTPKGVIVSHANIMHNERLIQQAFGHTEESIGVGWLPLYHDMGLIGNVIQPLYAGFPVYLMSPIDFLKNPFLWLNAISHYRATSSGGPNFAYDLCVRKITAEKRALLDLNSWVLAFNGAEPVRAATLERFTTTFKSCGFRREAFYPCYGLAESTLFVAGGSKGTSAKVLAVNSDALSYGKAVLERETEEKTQPLVSCGHVAEELEIVIANSETALPVPTGDIGEIWVAGESIAQGYWQQLEHTTQVFQASLANNNNGPYLRTGDLGFFYNGELYVTGRIKDLIIIRGRNYYPQDIELTVEQSYPNLRQGCSAAFSIDVDSEERLAVAVELDKNRQDNFAAIVEAIRGSVSATHQVQVYAVLLLKAGTIPKTSSGKIQRYACRKEFLNNSLDTVFCDLLTASRDLIQEDQPQEPLLNRELLKALPQPLRIAQLQSYLLEQIARLLKTDVATLNIEQSLIGLGFDSLMVVELKNCLEATLAISIKTESLFE